MVLMQEHHGAAITAGRSRAVPAQGVPVEDEPDTIRPYLGHPVCGPN
jgi:hypothetical protein